MGARQERLRKRPRMPAGLNADQKAKNREIVKRMQMKARDERHSHKEHVAHPY